MWWMSGKEDVLLDRAQLDEVQRRLDAGMTPEEIAESLGRVAGLDEVEVVRIRSAAYDI
jgi:hypothetical protein